jgi:hypothetical protein
MQKVYNFKDFYKQVFVDLGVNEKIISKVLDYNFTENLLKETAKSYREKLQREQEV